MGLAGQCGNPTPPCGSPSSRDDGDGSRLGSAHVETCATAGAEVRVQVRAVIEDVAAFEVDLHRSRGKGVVPSRGADVDPPRARTWAQGDLRGFPASHLDVCGRLRDRCLLLWLNLCELTDCRTHHRDESDGGEERGDPDQDCPGESPSRSGCGLRRRNWGRRYKCHS